MQFWLFKLLKGGAKIVLHLPNTKTTRRKHCQEQSVMHDATACFVILRLLARVVPSFTILQTSVSREVANSIETIPAATRLEFPVFRRSGAEPPRIGHDSGTCRIPWTWRDGEAFAQRAFILLKFPRGHCGKLSRQLYRRCCGDTLPLQLMSAYTCTCENRRHASRQVKHHRCN